MDYMVWLEEGLREQVVMNPSSLPFEKFADTAGDDVVELHSYYPSQRRKG
jgi:hypothetical protein